MLESIHDRLIQKLRDIQSYGDVGYNIGEPEPKTDYLIATGYLSAKKSQSPDGYPMNLHVTDDGYSAIKDADKRKTRKMLKNIFTAMLYFVSSGILLWALSAMEKDGFSTFVFMFDIFPFALLFESIGQKIMPYEPTSGLDGRYVITVLLTFAISIALVFGTYVCMDRTVERYSHDAVQESAYWQGFYDGFIERDNRIDSSISSE